MATSPEPVNSSGGQPRRLFAIVPAAGRSLRMGRAKLLLPLGAGTVIGRLLAAFHRPEIVATVVVVRRDDVPLCAEVVASGALPVQPAVDPSDMRQSVVEGIAEIIRRFQPRDDEGWILAPADHPLLDPKVLGDLIEKWNAGDSRILVPVHAGRRGHPTFFQWSLAREVQDLPIDTGLNLLLQNHVGDILEIPVDSPGVTTDLDTPEDYERLLMSPRP